MKRILFFSLIILLCAKQVLPQKTIEGISGKTDLNITKDPPVLSLVEGSLKFSDENANNCIDANESANITFSIINNGKGSATDLMVNVSQTGILKGLTFDKTISFGSLAAGATKTFSIPVKGTIEIPTGTAVFTIKVDEGSGFGLDEIQMEINTIAFASPLVKVTDYSVTSENSSTLVKKKPFDLQVMVQNIGKGSAKNVKISLTLPDNILCYSDNINNTFEKLSSGETKTITYSLIVNEKYTSTTIPVKLEISESYGKYSENKIINLVLNQNMSQNKIVVESKATSDNTVIQIASLGSDVDKNIPKTTNKNPNAFAVVIGNYDYKYVNKVDYAINDAQTIKKYLINVLGFSEGNIFYEANATKSTFETYFGTKDNPQGKLYNNIKPDISDVFIYYSGHGAPGLKDNKGYFVPTDCDPQYVEQGGYSLDLFYSNLSKLPAKSTTVLTDACFSGADIFKSISSVVITITNPIVAINNCVILSSSTGSQVSSWYDEKQHGMFTYFFLKALQDKEKSDKNKDNKLTYQEIFDYISDKTEGIPYYARSLHGVDQTPTIQGTGKDNVFIEYK